MKKLLLTLALTFFTLQIYANPVCGAGASDRAKAKEDLKKELLADYEDSYSTVKMLLKAGMKDYDKICKIRSTLINNEILEGLKADYYPSFTTIYMLFKDNKEAYTELEDDKSCSFRC